MSLLMRVSERDSGRVRRINYCLRFLLKKIDIIVASLVHLRMCLLPGDVLRREETSGILPKLLLCRGLWGGGGGIWL